jgi:parallel beta-helix repeat protein
MRPRGLWFREKAEVKIMKSGSNVRDFPGRTWVVRAVLHLWLAALPATCSATMYFVDVNHPTARDSNPGTEALPFKTIGKATSLVNAGDTVFVKAGIYRETVILSRSGTSTTIRGSNGAATITSPITIAAYPGHEGKVIISAAEPVNSWRKCTGPQECAGNPDWAHIYRADVTALVQAHPSTSFAVRQVFQHGKLLERSRYPDTGWSYPTRLPDPMKVFTDDTLSQPPGYFTGAFCHIKTADWEIEPIPITAFSQGTITLSKSPRYAITTRFGYYISRIVGEINAEGEWAYDPAQKEVFLWPQGDVPDGVEFSYRQYCVRVNAGTAWNVVRGLTLHHAYQDGLWLYRSHNLRIENNTMEYPCSFGIRVQGDGGACDDNQILGNTVRYCGYGGIGVSRDCSRNNVEGNYVYAIGTDTFAGDLLYGQTQAIYIAGPYTRVYNNRVDRCGWVGLYLSGPTLGRDVSYNYVTNTGLSLSDGGNLYTGGFSEVPEKDHIHHNILADAIGCLSMDRPHDNGLPPTVPTHSGNTSGLVVDEEGNNRVIEDNTIINAGLRGIALHWAPSNLVQRNTLYNNGQAQIWLSGKNETQKMLLGDILLDNILFARSLDQKTLYLGINYGYVQFGGSDRNYLYHPYDDRHIFASRYYPDRGWVQENLTLAGWRALTGYDLQSREFSYLEQSKGITLARPRESRIVYNPTLDVATVDLEGQKYCDVQGNEVSGSVVLQPFESKILIAAEFETPSPVLP